MTFACPHPQCANVYSDEAMLELHMQDHKLSEQRVSSPATRALKDQIKVPLESKPKKCDCEKGEPDTYEDFGWIPNVTPGLDAWHKIVRHGERECRVLTSVEVEAMRELSAAARVEGRKDDDGKNRWDLLPWRGLEQVALVLTFGAKKYAPDNWRKVAGWRWRYFRAAVGHLAAWVTGEKNDPESKLPHLAHAACCVLFLLELDQ